MTRDEFTSGLAAIAHAHPRTAALTAQQAELWWRMLNDLGSDEWQRAVMTAIQDGDDWPTISKLRQYAEGDKLALEDRAQQAWSELRQAAQTHGSAVTVQFEDPVIPAAVRSLWGGWVEFCGRDRSQNDRQQAQFVRTYASLCRTGITHAQAGPLIGWLDKDRGHSRDDCRRVIESTQAPLTDLRLTGPKPTPRIEGPKHGKRAKARAIVAQLVDDQAEKQAAREADIIQQTRDEEDARAAAVDAFRNAIS